jgi:CxxC-x17-CxxC domain-containing protein
VCRDCGQNFTFTEGEQEFFQTRGYTEPQRCADCRAAKKAARNSGDGYSSGGYSSSGSNSYGDSYGGGGSYERTPRQMTTVICSNCGKETQVPFVPTGDRPVYCSDCFSQMGGGSRGGNRSGGSRRY